MNIDECRTERVTDMDDDYTEDDRWDWDRSDERQRCQHGTFIGSFWGPDILCQWCEDGVPVEEMRATLELQARHKTRRKLEELEHLVMVVKTGMLDHNLPYNAGVADFLTRWVWEQTDMLPKATMPFWTKVIGN